MTSRPPNISAEKRFTTTVPLQRLFLMNSDFVQLESEALYKRVAAEPNNAARIRKLYNLVYGRDPKEPEVQIALEYLRTEPIKEYEESKIGAAEKDKEKEKEKEKKDAQAATPPLPMLNPLRQKQAARPRCRMKRPTGQAPPIQMPRWVWA